MNKSHNIVLQKSKEFNAWYLIDIILNSQLSNIRGGFLWISWVRSSWWLHILWICCSLSSQSWTPLWYQSFTCKLLIFLNSAGDFVQGRARDRSSDSGNLEATHPPKGLTLFQLFYDNSLYCLFFQIDNIIFFCSYFPLDLKSRKPHASRMIWVIIVWIIQFYFWYTDLSITFTYFNLGDE